MRRRAADLLVDPVHREELELVVWEAQSASLTADDRARALDLGLDVEALEEDVRTGVLVDRARSIAYPIYRSVPRLLPFRTGVADQFAASFAGRLARLRDDLGLPGLRLPDAEGAVGEADVLRSFSTEWTEYGWTEEAYWNMPAAEWFRCMDVVLALDKAPVAGQLVLEVGIGIGGVANHVARDHGAEVVGVDLGYAVDAAHPTFGSNPFLHIVQASAFAPPFRHGTFDFAYSFGVLHHTSSTRGAFERVAPVVKPGGRLYVWVYSPEDESRTAVRRALMLTERVVRPAMWRLPDPLQKVALAPLVPLYMLYQGRRVQAGEHEYSSYGWREAMHAARDRFTPRYIHRHTDAELKSWFAEAGFEDRWATREDPAAHDLPEQLWQCAGVHGTRPAPPPRN